MAVDEKYRQRLDALFADMERLASDPAGDDPRIRRELESIRARLRELETWIAENEDRARREDRDSKSAPPLLYEKDRVGYVYADGAVESLRDPARAAPDPARTVATPLTAGRQTIGELQVAPPPARAWTAEERDLLNAVARQASIQIQNLRLLEATERARAEAQEATRRFMHERWESFLDAIHQSEVVGYAYDQGALAPFTEGRDLDGSHRESVAVLDEQIGALILQPNPARPFTDEEKALIGAVARLVAQQVENLRLLADASRARAEAEEATRRLTRQNWEDYAAEKWETGLGFVYDANDVIPLGDAPTLKSVDFSQPLSVRGESIGQLAVAGGKRLSPEEAELAAAVAERVSAQVETLRLTEELQKRAAELQKLDRLKSEFLANMSHELRTPLNSILGFADVILEGLDGPLTGNMNDDLQLIRRNGLHLLHLINDVLDMAKIEAGRMNLSPEPFRIHDLLEEVTSITSTLASEKNLALFIEADSEREAEVFADRTRLCQVMLNLVNNAMKFTEQGKISLRAERRDGLVAIAVRDTGMGIPPDKLEEIFKEFTQVDSSATRKAGGTGLGLPISRRLIELHGGRLWAESAGIAGQGSVFFVELPLEAVVTESVETEKARK